jgi:hypothetical protein
MSRAITIVTSIVLILNAALILTSFAIHWIVIPAALLAAVTLGCYIRAPVAYEVSTGDLIILFRLGFRRFGSVITAGKSKKSMDRSIRLWGNGGLFAGTGIFWNGTLGIFRAYVTTSDHEKMVLVETLAGKVLISPTDPDAFLENWKLSLTSGGSAGSP